MLNSLFGAWPYLAALLFAAGILLRCIWNITRSGLPEQRTGLRPEDALGQLAGGPPRYLALLALLAVHLVILALPHELLAWTRVTKYLYLWEALACIAGVWVLAGAARLAWQQLAWASGSRRTQVADTVFLALLLTGLLSGVLMAVLHRWASAWGVLLLTPYVRSVFAGHPAVAQLAQVPFLARVHILSTVTLPAVFPFSRFAVLLTEPLRWGTAILLRLFAAAWLPCRRMLDWGFRRASLTLGLSPEEE